MNLYEIVNKIKEISKAQPNIQLCEEGDIYKLNESAGIEYPAIIITQTQHNKSILDDYITYNFNIFYVDRLTSDYNNKLDVQSQGIQVLKNVFRLLENQNIGILNQTINFNTFTERFEAECAGAYAALSINVLDLDCEGEYYE